ncbi:hypothetical protein C1645_876103 [Glomus cerebriforme]|uniref:BED-type domain-containing protein n=1 Tax=Glomus cerebriforme TaxID=658196 RepID=A0A397T5T1_9GLOM|nr:hypothetical protein C1645_876103 [Glomus cerebriforme]
MSIEEKKIGEGEVKEEGKERKTYLVMQCQVRETSSSAICGKEYSRKDSSTGNAISHLRLKHNISQMEKLSEEGESTMKKKKHSEQ